MELTELRKKMDGINQEILGLFLERMKLSEEIGAYKKENSLPVLDKTRERDMLAAIEEAGGEYGQYAYFLFSTLAGLSKARQSEMVHEKTKVGGEVEEALLAGGDVFPRTGVVACQGVEGSNSQAACDKLLPRGRIVFVKTFEAVFDAVGSGLCKYGVLPIENSTNGSVRAVYDLLQKKRFSIVRSTSLYIRHELLAKPGARLKDLCEIYSHEQAIGQCSKFIASLGEGVKVIPCGNTALAAKLVSESGRGDCAAICAHQCADLYGLAPVAQDIQDSDNNYTRFICIAKDPVIYAGADKISLILSCNNQPGALYDILSKLAVRGINMSKLESCPVSGKNFEFVFFLELDASVKEPGVVSMLEELERSCEGFHFLGSYAAI